MKLKINNPDDVLTDPRYWPGRAVNPGETEQMPYFIIHPYREPRCGPWAFWKNPGCAPGTPGSG